MIVLLNEAAATGPKTGVQGRHEMATSGADCAGCCLRLAFSIPRQRRGTIGGPLLCGILPPQHVSDACDVRVESGAFFECLAG